MGMVGFGSYSLNLEKGAVHWGAVEGSDPDLGVHRLRMTGWCQVIPVWERQHYWANFLNVFI